MTTCIQLEYRAASEPDIDQLVKLRIKQLVDEGYPETTDINLALQSYFAESLNNGSLICWVGLANNLVVATAGLCFYQLPPTFSNPTGRIAYITNMYTDGAYRRRGIASELLEILIDKAKAMDYESLRLHASSQGKSIYLAAGFADTDGYMGMKL